MCCFRACPFCNQPEPPLFWRGLNPPPHTTRSSSYWTGCSVSHCPFTGFLPFRTLPSPRPKSPPRFCLSPAHMNQPTFPWPCQSLTSRYGCIDQSGQCLLPSPSATPIAGIQLQAPHHLAVTRIVPVCAFRLRAGQSRDSCPMTPGPEPSVTGALNCLGLLGVMSPAR